MASGRMTRTTRCRAIVPCPAGVSGGGSNTGSAYAGDGAWAEDARKRRLPLVGKGTGIFSFRPHR
jgi:hypothetical protein